MAPRTVAPLLAAVVCVALAAAPSQAAAKVNYGPISHKGLQKVGATSTGLKLGLQIGLVANNSGVQKAAKSASNPSSSSYGKYLSLSKLQSKYGATSSKRKAVVNAFKSKSVKAKVDVTHLRVSATLSVGKAQKMFGTKWANYKTSSGDVVALPVNTPKLPKGHEGERRHRGGHAADREAVIVVRPPGRGPVADPPAARSTTAAPPRGPAPWGRRASDTTDPAWSLGRPPACTRTRSWRRTGSRRFSPPACWDRARGWRSSARRPRRPRT